MARSIPYPSSHLVVFLPLLNKLQTFYVNVCSEVQHWEEAQYNAQYLYPQACLVDQRYHGILQLIYPIWRGLDVSMPFLLTVASHLPGDKFTVRLQQHKPSFFHNIPF